ELRRIFQHSIHRRASPTVRDRSLFCGHVNADQAGGIHGLAGEGEDIRSHVLPCDQALERLNNGGITSAMSIIALQWLALNRAQLQGLWHG
ncbi:MAG: ADP-ribose diphosphatase, partial [Ectothiorhodospiraceae bacterium]